MGRGIRGRAVTAVGVALAVVVAAVPPSAAQIDETGGSAPQGGGAAVSAAVPGGPDAHRIGAWSAVARWPLSAIHSILLPDGTVMTYGTDGAGTNSTGLTYDIWDPAEGLDAASHTTLPVNTSTNLFCSAQTVLPWNGRVLITGGEERGLPGGRTGGAVDDVNLFDPGSRTVTRLADSMARSRWYPTVTTLPSGEVLVHGGRDDEPPERPILTPEVYHPTNGWRRLTGASSAGVYGKGRWWYPRSWVAPNGRVFIITKGNRGMWSLDPEGAGAMRRLGTYPGVSASDTTPAAMFDVGKVLMLSSAGTASVIDIRKATPKVTRTRAMSSPRAWSDATVLANGEVLVTGGASRRQQLRHARYAAEIWNPATGRWRTGAKARRARLYHSSSLLLPDGSVLTAGGGPPGPVTNLNAEIYHPPYLFARDGSGRAAARPRIAGMGQIRHGRSFTVDLAGDSPIASVALVRTGSVTHSFDMDQRWQELAFTQSGRRLTVRGPRNTRVAPPGQYMLFVLNRAGTPSMARIQRIPSRARPTSTAVQAGTLTLTSSRAGGRWVTATFPRPFRRTPVVTVGAPSATASDPAVARVRDVTRTGFQISLDEWDRVDGDHGFERLSYLAAEPGRHTVGGVTLEAGAVTATDAPRRVDYRGRFGSVPVVMTQVAGSRNPQPVITRTHGSFRGSFRVRLQEREARRRADRVHGNETVHWMALSGRTGRVGARRLRVGRTAVAVTHRWKTISLKDRYPDGGFMAAAQTTTDRDPAAPRYRRLTATRVQVRLQEDRTHDREVGHGPERIGWVVFGAR